LRTISEQLNPAAQWKHDLAAKVGASAVFERSPRLRELLTYLCEQALQNRLEDLKEQAIGRRVFGRAPDYSSGEDNIVRVEVRHLRKRLEEYFAGEGKSEPVVIVIRKGGYVPEFEPRKVLPAVAPPPPEPKPAPRREWRIPAGRRVAWLAAFLAVGVALAGVWWWSARESAAERSAQAGSRDSQRGPIWQMLFDGQQAVTVICADSTLVMAQFITHHPISLEEYARKDYGQSAPQLTPDQKSLLQTLQGWQFTDVIDLRLAQRMSRLNADFWDRVLVRSAKTVQLQDFKSGNAVLLGSSHSNPWVLLFEPQLNFRFGFDFGPQKRAAYILNTAPQAGEQAVYRAARPGESGEVYSTIALAPNLRHSGHVLIIAGTTAEGTEAAGEFLMNPGASGGLIRELLSRNKGRMPYFEVLLKSGAFAGVAQSARVVAIRTLPGN